MISRGTTPTYKLTLPDDVAEDIDLTTVSELYVTFSDPHYKKLIEKTGEDLEVFPNYVNVFLTQEETLKFPTGNVLVQMNWLVTEGTKVIRMASTIEKTTTCRNLKEEVM